MAGPIEITITTDADKAATGIGRVSDQLEDLDSALERVDRSGGDAERALSDVADASGDVDAKHIDDVSDALDDVDTAAGKADDSLKDVDAAAKDAGDAGKDIDRDLTKALEDADDAAQKAKDGLDDVETSAKGAGSAAAGMDTDFKKAGETTATFRDETRANLSESVSSFRGDVEDIPQLLQDVLGGVSADLGGIASLAAVGGAAVIGIVIGQLTSMSERINEAKEEMGALALEMTEAGEGLDGVDLTGKMREWAFEVQDARSWFEIWQKEAVNNLENVARAADEAGVPLSDFWAAMVNPDTEVSNQYLADMKDRLADVTTELDDALVAQGTRLDATQAQLDADADNIDSLTAEKNALSDLIDPLEQEVTAKEKAYEQSVLLRAAEEGVTEEAIKQRDAIAANNAEIESNNELKAEAAELAGNAFLAEGNYTASVQDATTAIAENGSTLDANTEAGRNNRSALIDAASSASTYAQTMADAGRDQETVNGILQRGRTDFLNMATAAGMGAAEANKLADELGLVPGAVTTEVAVNGAETAQTKARNVKGDVDAIPDTKNVTITTSIGSNFAVNDSLDLLTRPRAVTVTPRIGQNTYI